MLGSADIQGGSTFSTGVYVTTDGEQHGLETIHLTTEDLIPGDPGWTDDR